MLRRWFDDQDLFVVFNFFSMYEKFWKYGKDLFSAVASRVHEHPKKCIFFTYSAVHKSGATLQNCPFCKFQVEFMICALIVYGQVIYFCKGFATRILLKKIFFLK